MLGIDGEYQPATQKPKFHSSSKKLQKKAIKHCIEKSILLNFVNLSTKFCPRLQLNGLTRRKGCLGRNEGKVLFTISYTQILITILIT